MEWEWPKLNNEPSSQTVCSGAWEQCGSIKYYCCFSWVNAFLKYHLAYRIRRLHTNDLVEFSLCLIRTVLQLLFKPRILLTLIIAVFCAVIWLWPFRSFRAERRFGRFLDVTLTLWSLLFESFYQKKKNDATEKSEIKSGSCR